MLILSFYLMFYDFLLYIFLYFCVVNTAIFSTLNFSFFSVLFVARRREDYAERGGESRTAISDRALVLGGGGGLEKPNRGRDLGETFFPDSGSDLDSDETFQISRNLGLELDEIVCLLDSQPCLQLNIFTKIKIASGI